MIIAASAEQKQLERDEMYSGRISHV